MKIKLGSGVSLDMDQVAKHRALIQAASGGGKSYLLRLIAERVGPSMPIIVIDPEGEFASLRELLDVVLVSSEGEVPPDPKNAKALARRLLELGVSAVIDLYELPIDRRHIFVRDFANALVDAPRSLWRPLLILLDEAHVYCPERGQDESPASKAVVGLMSRGRKRGYATILATQRLSKLSKNAAGECGTLFIGRTSPIDKRRAADLLGIAKQDADVLPHLAPGEWMASGPAIGRVEPVRFMADRAKTSHPEPGGKGGKPGRKSAPAPSKAIQQVAKELADLARQEEDAPLTLEDAQATIQRLRQEIRRGAGRVVTAPVQKRPVPPLPAFTKSQEVALGRLSDLLDRAPARLTEAAEAALRPLNVKLGKLKLDVRACAATTQRSQAPASKPFTVPFATGRIASSQQGSNNNNWDGQPLGAGEKRTLAALIQFSVLNRSQLIILTGAARSSRDAYIQRLKAKGLVDASGDTVSVNDAGRLAMPDAQPLPIGSALREHWNQRLPKGEREVLAVLVNAYPDSVERETIDAQTSFARSSRDAYLQRLIAKQLVERAGTASVKAASSLFDIN